MGGLGTPCGGCKFMRRKCVEGCVFAPYFCHEKGSSDFAAIHRVFGASNFSKLISHLPDHARCDAVLTISYEALSRLHNPIYGCNRLLVYKHKWPFLEKKLLESPHKRIVRNKRRL